jgi:DNA replicative helicase MCM subunit Mcm2 (Cdc46/Mcm family)
MNDVDDMARYNPEPYYITRLREATDIESSFLDIDCQHLYDYDPKLYTFLEDYPTDVIPIFDLVATQV